MGAEGPGWTRFASIDDDGCEAEEARRCRPGFVRDAIRGDDRFLLRIAVVAALGGFLFGYDTGIISGAQLCITRDLHASRLEQQWLVGALLVGAILDAGVPAWAADRIVRTWTKVVAGSIYAAGGLASAFAPTVPFLLVSRFVLGLAVGAASFVAVEYISEQAPERLRGGVTTFNQLMVTTAILVSYLVAAGFQNVPGTCRWMLGLSAVPAWPSRWACSRCRAPPAGCCPRTGRTRPARCCAGPQRRGGGRRDRGGAGGPRPVRVHADPGPVRSAAAALMVVGLVLALGQQLIGVNTVSYCSATILQSTGLSASSSVLQAISVGVTNVAFTVVAIVQLDRVADGRCCSSAPRSPSWPWSASACGSAWPRSRRTAG